MIKILVRSLQCLVNHSVSQKFHRRPCWNFHNIFQCCCVDLSKLLHGFVKGVTCICILCLLKISTLQESATSQHSVKLRVWVSISKTLAPKCLSLGLKNFNLEKISVSAFGHQNIGLKRSLNIGLKSFGLEEVSVLCFFGIKEYLSSNVLRCQKVYIKEAELSDS